MKQTAFIVIFLVLCTSIFAQLPHPEAVTFFHTQQDKEGQKGVVRGTVLSLGAREIADEELMQLAQSKTKVTVRLSSIEGIQPGNELFIINERNLIVARFSVTTMFKSSSFGYLLVGYGNFRRVQKNFRVVQEKSDNASQYAYIHRARGDYHLKNGQKAEAMLEYEKGIKKNRAHAESHIQLGYVYLNDGVHEYALREFMEAYKTRSFIHDREDLYRLFQGILQVHYFNAYQSGVIDSDGIKRNIESGIEIAIEALSYFPDEAQLHYYLGIFYFDNPRSDDIRARDQMLKVIEYDDTHVDAYVTLGRLYRKHDNSEKALMYVEKALTIDPTHRGAQEVYTLLNRDQGE